MIQVDFRLTNPTRLDYNTVLQQNTNTNNLNSILECAMLFR